MLFTISINNFGAIQCVHNHRPAGSSFVHRCVIRVAHASDSKGPLHGAKSGGRPAPHRALSIRARAVSIRQAGVETCRFRRFAGKGARLRVSSWWSVSLSSLRGASGAWMSREVRIRFLLIRFLKEGNASKNKQQQATASKSKEKQVNRKQIASKSKQT